VGAKMGALAVAVSMDLSHAAIVASAKVDDRLLVKPLQHAPGTDWAVGRLAELQDQHDVDVAIDGRGPAARLIPHLEDAGVRLHIYTTPEVLDAWDTFYSSVREGQLLHCDYPELNAAVNGATTRSVGDRTAWARRTASSDISPLEGGTLAVHQLTVNSNQDEAVNLW
jgi:hypothetical protein